MSFDGEQIRVLLGTPPSALIDSEVTVGPGVELEDVVDNSYDIDISASRIEILQVLPNTTVIYVEFGPITFTDVDGQVPAIIGVSVTETIADADFTTSDVTFDADNIFVDLDGIAVGPGEEVTIDVIFDVPVATDDSYSIAEDNILAITAADGVLANDSDPGSDPLAATVETGPDHGNLTFDPDGSFTYMPDPDFNGTDSFTYTASDGAAASEPATVEITVTPVNDPPTATNDSYSIAEDNVLTVTAANGVLHNDGDVENDPLTATVATGPDHGTLVLDLDGSFTYTPDPDFNGQDSFTYAAFDGQEASQPVTVELIVTSVNDAPFADDDTAGTALLTATTIDVLANDSDIDSSLDPASVTVTDDPANGTAIANPDGTVTYTPNFLFVGEDSFAYTVDDDQGATSNAATVGVTVELDLNPITGTNGHDFRFGTNGADLIQTLDGNDNVSARGGDDIVLGGAGNDRLIGEAGDDLLMGGSGIENLSGGAGLDILVGGPGNDNLAGGSGLDTAIFAGAFADHGISGFGTTRIVQDHAGDGGRDILSSVELLQFDDGVFDASSGQFDAGGFATPEVEALVTSPGFTTDPGPILAPVA